MRLPRPLLLPLCAILTAAAYYLILFTDQGNYYRQGRPVVDAVGFDAAVVLAAFACWEVFRTERITPVRAVAAAVGVPLALFVLATLLHGVRRYVPL